MTAVELITMEMESSERFKPGVRAKTIVVAADGSETAIAAFRLASVIASHASASVHVLTVLEPIPPLFPSVEGFVVPPELDRAREDAQRTIVGDQIKPYDAERAWSLDVSIGRPAEAIVSFAREQCADLIILGLNKHGVVGRILGEETAGEVARLSTIPILVAAPQTARLPKRVIVAMGLNPGVMHSLPEIIRIVADNPGISCVHVKPRSESLGIDWVDLDNGYELAIKARFREIEIDLDAAHMRADLVVLNGDATRELVEFAEYSKAELLIVGVKRRQGKARAIGGRMAARILRHATCSILILPDGESLQ